MAVLGLALVLGSPLLWMATLDNSFLRRSALLMWVAMAAGGGLALLAARRDRRRRTRSVAVLAVLWIAMAVPGFVVLTRLPAPSDVVGLRQVADFTLTNHQGQPVTLSDVTATGPALLVFYRGFW